MKWSLFACAAVLAGCGGGGASSLDAATGGTCSAEVPSGQACNQLTDVGELVAPTCMKDPVPVGAGGTIVPGTYVMTDQIYYGTATCPVGKISGSIVIAADCIQGVSTGAWNSTSSQVFVVHQNGITTSPTCTSVSIDSGVNYDAPNLTFTATPSTLTLFTGNAAVGNSNPDRATVFVRR